MKHKVSYTIVKYEATERGSKTISCKNLKELEKEIKKHMLLRDGDFEVRLTRKSFPKYVKGEWNILPFDVDHELWHYDFKKDGVSRYNLRDNHLKPMLLQKQRRLRKLMITFNR